MDYQEDWSTRATNDLKAAYEYVRRSNPDAAEAVISKIIDTISLLHGSPRLGSLFLLRDDQEIRQIVAGSFRIFYMPADADESLRIMTIQHVKRADPEF